MWFGEEVTIKRFTVVLDDDNLYNALELEAANTGCVIDEIIKEALEPWLAATHLDEQEKDEIESSQTEWREQGALRSTSSLEF